MNTKAQLNKAMPAKTEKYNDGSDWRKRGGHAGSRTIATSIEKFTKLGFGKSTWKGFGSPDGSVVGHGNILVDQYGNKVQFSESYGCCAADNYYSISLSFSKEYLDLITKTV